jgi:cytochrome c oxidase subunit 1
MGLELGYLNMSDHSHDTHGDADNLHAAHDHHLHEEPKSFFWKYLISFDHKMIAKQFMLLGIFWAAIGALLSLLIRWSVAYPGVPVPVIGHLLFPHTAGAVQKSLLNPQQYSEFGR